MNEEWKPVENYENLYWVSNFGNLKNKNKILNISLVPDHNKTLESVRWGTLHP